MENQQSRLQHKTARKPQLVQTVEALPVPVFDGLEEEYTVGSPAVTLKVKGVESEKLTVFKRILVRDSVYFQSIILYFFAFSYYVIISSGLMLNN
jgi:hypothetical protein